MFFIYMCMFVKVYCLLDIRYVYIGKYTCISVRIYIYRYNIVLIVLVICSSRCILLKC